MVHCKSVLSVVSRILVPTFLIDPTCQCHQSGGSKGTSIRTSANSLNACFCVFCCRGERFATGNLYLRPHETFHEPNRKFFHNEVGAVIVQLLLYIRAIPKGLPFLDVCNCNACTGPCSTCCEKFSELQKRTASLGLLLVFPRKIQNG